MVWIRSEHAIRFLKGCFHLLKNLHVSIKNKKCHILATYWVAVHIGIHSFAMQCEERERQLDASDSDLSPPEDPFIAGGLSSSSELDAGANTTVSQPQHNGATYSHTQRLQAGKAHHEKLKKELFRAKMHKVHRRAQFRAEQYGVHGSELDSDSGDIDMA